jgi:hypothetical protein
VNDRHVDLSILESAPPSNGFQFETIGIVIVSNAWISSIAAVIPMSLQTCLAQGGKVLLQALLVFEESGLAHPLHREGGIYPHQFR